MTQPPPSGAIPASWKQDPDAAYSDYVASAGTARLAILGATGVGKSTLVNSIFGTVVAPTGIGEPVTEGVNKHVHSSGALVVYDFEGFELGRSTKQSITWLEQQFNRNRKGERAELIDVAWYCLQWRDRISQGQVDLIEAINKLGVPVVVVLTQVPLGRDGQPHPDAISLAQVIEGMRLPLAHPRVFLTDALGDVHLGYPPHGLKLLLEWTFRLAPEGKVRAFTIAQGIDMAAKRREAQKLVGVAGTLAAGMGAIPIPFADATVLVPTQLALIARIGALYGLPKAMLLSGSGLTTTVTTLVGRQLVASATKVIPGVGSVVSATVAATLTTATGLAWAKICEGIVTGKISADVLKNGSALTELFTAVMRRKI